MAKDFIEPGYRDGDSAISEFDQIQAVAIERLRRAKSFFIAIQLDDEGDTGLYHISAIQNENNGDASAFLLAAAMEASRLFTHSIESAQDE